MVTDFKKIGAIMRVSNEYKQLQREQELLTSIAYASSQDDVNKYKIEFHSRYNEYPFEMYLEILEKIYRLLLKGVNNTQIISIIRNKADGLFA